MRDEAVSGRVNVGHIVAGACLLITLCAGVFAIKLWPDQIAGLLRRASSVAQNLGAAGWLLAFGAQTLIALCGILPASAGALAAGAAFGVAGGFSISASATFIGAMLAFLITRTLFRPMIARSLARRPRVVRLDEAITRDGWRLVVLMRLSPVMPFAATSYALGLTSLGLRTYLIGTLASMPALLGYVAMGSMAGAGIASLTGQRATPLHWIVLGLAILATALLTLRLSRIIGGVLRLPAPPASVSDAQR